MSESQTLVDKLDLNQTQGIFRVTKQIEEDRYLREWRERYSQECCSRPYTPIIIEEEKYSRTGVRRELFGFNRGSKVFEKFYNYDLLRESEIHQKTHSSSPQSTLSIAQTISWALQIPIEDILISQQATKDPIFLDLPPEERVSQLFNAYEGVHWFEIFKRTMRRGKIRKIPAETELNIGRLREVLDTQPRNIYDLRDAGLLIFPGEEHLARTVAHYTDKSALTQLLALIYGCNKEDIVDEKDPHLVEILTRNLVSRMISYSRKRKIGPGKWYSTREAASKVGLGFEKVSCDAIRRGNVPSQKRGNRGHWHIKGTDLIYYGIRNELKLYYEIEEVAKLLGVTPKDVMSLGFFVNADGTYSTRKDIGPLYDEIAVQAKEMIGEGSLDKDLDYPVEIQGKFYYPTPAAKKSYCTLYDLLENGETREEIDDIFDEWYWNVLSEGEKVTDKSGRELKSEELIFVTNGNAITSFRIPTKNVYEEEEADYFDDDSEISFNGGSFNPFEEFWCGN